MLVQINRTQQTTLKTLNAFFSSLFKIRQNVESTKMAQNFTRINLVQFLPEIPNQHFTQNKGYFGLFHSIKSYAGIIGLID